MGSRSVKNKTVVPFKSNAGISHALMNSLLNKGKKYGLNRIIPFSPDKIAVAEWVLLKCQYGCSCYSTNWTCPPMTPDPGRARAILNEYSLALFLIGSRNCSDFYLDNSRKRANQVRCWKGTILLERMLFLEGYYKAFSLVGECCALCKRCAYPDACRFPQEKRPAVESFSIDVIGTLHNLDTNSTVATNLDDNFNYYSIILLE